MEIKAGNHDKLKQLAEVHKAAFPGSLSSAMGKKYLKAMLSWYFDSPSAFLYYAEKDNRILGFVGGFLNDGSAQTGSSSSMLQHSFKQAVTTFFLKPWLFFHPQMFKKYRLAFKNLKRFFNKDKHIALKPRPASTHFTGLVVIAVHPDFHGKGVGSKLLQTFEAVSKEKKVSYMRLTVNSNNEAAIKSYLRNGWVKIGESADGLKMEKKI
jgi:ribosomal protein S18 acetylase RimI-like enzyme